MTLPDGGKSQSFKEVRILAPVSVNFSRVMNKDLSMKIKYMMLGMLFPAMVSAETLRTEDVVVTASRIMESESSVLAPVEVVTREQIEKMELHTVKEVLELLPGIDAISYGGRGQSANFYVRGGKAEHVLVLLDGNPLNSTGIAAVNPNYLPADIIERIEYIRGHRATVYGANALSGVINIITRPAYKNHQELSYSFGTHEAHDLSVNNAVALSDSDVIKVAGGVSSAEGYNVHPLPGLNEGDRHGYKNKNLELLYAHTTGAGIEISGSYNYIFNRGDYDNSYYYDWGNVHETDRNQVERNIFNVGSNYTGELYRYDLGLMFSKSNDYNYPKGQALYGLSSSVFKVQAFNGHFVNYWNPLGDLLTGFGLDYDNNVLDRDSNTYGTKFGNRDISLVNRGYSLLAKYNDEMFLGEASVRLDDNSRFGTKTTFDAGLGVKIIPLLAISVRGGTAFRAPTLSELYYPATFGPAGNINLKPEKSSSVEFNIKGGAENFGYYLNGYLNNVRDMIAWVNGYENVSKARIRGLEAGLEYSFAKWLSVKAMADLMDPEDRETGKDIAYRSRQTYKALINGEACNFDYFGNYRFVSHRNVGYGPRLPGYGTVSIGVGYTWNDRVRFGVKADNLFDRKYETQRGYPSEGAVVSGTITLKNFF